MDIETLKKMARNKNNWRERLEAVKLCKDNDCQQSRDIIARLAKGDPVFKVKEEAFRVSQFLDIKENGKPLYLRKMPKGNLVSEINKKLLRVKNLLGDDFELDEFKDKFKAMYPEAYDIYDGNKGDKLNEWLSNVIATLPKNK